MVLALSKYLTGVSNRSDKFRLLPCKKKCSLLSLFRKAKLTKPRESVGRLVSLAHLRVKTRALGGAGRAQAAMAAQPGLLRLPRLSASGPRTAREGRWQLARPSVRPSVGAGSAPGSRGGTCEAQRDPEPGRGGGTCPGRSASGRAGPSPLGPARRAALAPAAGSAEAEAAGGTWGHRLCWDTLGNPCAGRGDSCRLSAVTEFLRPFAAVPLSGKLRLSPPAETLAAPGRLKPPASTARAPEAGGDLHADLSLAVATARQG